MSKQPRQNRARQMRALRAASGSAVALVLAVAGMGGTMALMAPTPAVAQQSIQRIAAVVNDNVISLRDVQERLALTLVSSNIPNTPENRQKLLPTVLRTLIDDQLRLQEAERVKVTVSPEDVQNAMRRIEQGNNMPPGALPQMLQQAGLPVSALEKQLRPQIAWIKAMQASLRRQIYVQPEEVDASLNQLRDALGKPQRRVSELILAVPSAEQDQQALEMAERLIEQLAQGANFAALAQQFSAAATARQGGDLGWVSPGQLSPEVDEVIQQLQPGQISKPLRTAGGYVLLMVTDMRQGGGASNPQDITYHLSQLYMPTRGAAAIAPEKSNEIINKALGTAQTCEDLNALAEDAGLPSSGDIGELKLADLPGPVGQTVASMSKGQISQPITLSDAQVMVMVCDRSDPNGLPDRDEVTQRLERQKLERLADRRLRDLRRQALIDIRL